MKKIKKIFILTSMFTTLSAASVMDASASYYWAQFSRGAKWLTYCETDFYWETRKERKSSHIINSSATQSTSGIAMEAGGTFRFRANDMEHDWRTTCKQKFGIGKLSYTITYTDEFALTNAGKILEL